MATNLSMPPFVSEFQAIYSLVHRRMVGVEAFVRFQASNNNDNDDVNIISTGEWFREQLEQASHTSIAQMDLEIIRRHVAVFHSFQRHDLWLFLNISAPSILCPDFATDLQQVLIEGDVPISRIVLEFNQDAVSQHTHTQNVTPDVLDQRFDELRRLGFLLAIDNFSLHHAHIDKVFDMVPHFVKLNARHVPLQEPYLLQRLVHLLHELEAFVHLTCVETQEDIEMALESGCDFVQGFWLDHPSVHPTEQETTIADRVDQVWSKKRDQQIMERTLSRRQRDLVQQAFMDGALSLTQHKPFDQAVQGVLHLPQVLRCFILDEQGFQVGHLLTNEQLLSHSHPGFSPLQQTDQANWSRQDYFQYAVEQPGILHTSPTYLSIADASRCQTLSMGIEIHGVLHVFCTDLFVVPVHTLTATQAPHGEAPHHDTTAYPNHNQA